MKRGTLVMTVLVVIAMLFASCSSGLSDNAEGEGGSSTKTVSVSLGVEFEGEVAQKVIDSDDDVGNLTYWYKAEPQWQQDKPIHGGTTDDGTNYYYVLIPNCASGVQKNLGNFTAGTWLFSVQVKKGNDVIYSGSKEAALYTNNAGVVVTVNPDTSGAAGRVLISIQVPYTGAAESLSLDYTGPESDTGVGMTPGALSAGLKTYTATVADLTPGAYTFIFKYRDASNTVTEGAAQAVNVFSRQDSNISGILDAGNLIASNITINTPGFTGFSVTPPVNPAQFATVAPSTDLVFTASATSNLGNTVKYEWFVEGVSAGDAAAGAHANPGDPYIGTFTFNRENPRGYHVTCVATDVNAQSAIVHTASVQLWVKVGYSATIDNGITNGTVAFGTAETIFAENDIVPLTVTPANGYKLGQITVNGTPVGANVADYYNSALNTRNASCYMPAAAATISATFVEDN